VDDDADMRLYLASLLRSHGYSVVEADDPREARRLVHQIKPALIIMDALISFGTSLNLYRELKQDRRLRKIAVIMLADVPRKTFFHYRALRGGAPDNANPEPEAFLEKPPEADELLYWVDSLVAPESWEPDTLDLGDKKCRPCSD
jgi:CheY-like chemotaxis protein